MIPFFCFMETQIELEKVEIEGNGCHLLLEATLDGVPIRLVLDTGASRTVLDSNFYQTIFPTEELKEEDEKSIGVGSNQLESFLVNVKSFGLGELKIENHETALMDLTYVSLTYQKLNIGEVHGVLGGDILEQFEAIIDYGTLKLNLKV